MAKRVTTKIGDVFSVQIDQYHIKYLQYVIRDLSQLNSDVIRAFKKIYFIDEIPDLNSIVNDEVDFYAHCDTIAGIKRGCWVKIGNSTNVGNINSILFKDSSDWGNPKINISERWWIWKPNEESIYVGKLKGEHRQAEPGHVFLPERIVRRMLTGEYGGVYPNFE